MASHEENELTGRFKHGRGVWETFLEELRDGSQECSFSYSEYRGQGSLPNEYGEQNSLPGENGGQCSLRSEDGGRGSFLGDRRGQGEVLKVVNEREVKSSTDLLCSRKDSKGSFLKEYIGTGEGLPSGEVEFITEEEQESLDSSLKLKVREHKNYKKMKHLFEDLEVHSFRGRCKYFNHLSLRKAIVCASNAGTIIYEAPRKSSKYFKEALKDLPPRTLREAINQVKYTTIRCMEKGSLHEVRDPSFPKIIPNLTAVVKREIKALTGVDTEYNVHDLLRILSSPGRCIVSVRLMDAIFNNHLRAADYIISHPDMSHIFKLGNYPELL